MPPSEADSPHRLEFVDHGLEECGHHTPAGGRRPARRVVSLYGRGDRLPSPPGKRCGGEYLIGVASTSELPSSLTPVSLSGTPGDPSVAATSPAAVARPGAGTGSRQLPGAHRRRSRGSASARATRGARPSPGMDYRAAGGRSAAEGGGESGAGSPRPPSRACPANPVSGRMAPGERVTLWVAPGGSCTTGTQVEAVVRFVGTHTVWLEDLANPSGTFSDAEFEGLDAFYASRVQPSMTVTSASCPTSI